MADHIVVNSPWAREGLIVAGIEPTKLRVVPLAYEGSDRAIDRLYPDRFDSRRPLRVLVLGSIIIRKGIAALSDAIRLLRGGPVEFHLVGTSNLHVPEDIVANPKAHMHGPLPRGAVEGHYRGADVSSCRVFRTALV